MSKQTLIKHNFKQLLATFFISYYDKQMWNYFTNYHIPTYFDTIVSSSGSLKSVPYEVTQVFQMQLLVIQFTIKVFHIRFMQVGQSTK